MGNTFFDILRNMQAREMILNLVVMAWHKQGVKLRCFHSGVGIILFSACMGYFSTRQQQHNYDTNNSSNCKIELFKVFHSMQVFLSIFT